jgi:hypothetical protein
MDDGEHKQALGVALESGRLDVVSRVFELTKDTELLSYVMDAVLDTGFSLSYRNQVFPYSQLFIESDTELCYRFSITFYPSSLP